MSTTIDERVVSMEFDNRQFEANVKTSLGTLDKLKQSLNFGGASKGLENVNAAAKNVNMNSLSSGVESVRLKFSALEVMAVTALGNITNSAVNAGKRIVSALTIDPIKTGFAEYETKINAIQTIMSNTASKGTTMADVTRVIDELNTYADKTIYNFAEMTKNIGTFTAAGVGLEDSAAAIQGIANLAAASGSNSQKASVAMYQLSQALAAGTVKLMDWNSVVNAGMGGEKFQDALKQTAREMGIAVDDIIKKNGSFRESLRDGWITADVLNTTLKKFTTEGAAEYADAMLQSGKYTKEQAEALKEEARSMEDAATKVKTFTQLWDTLKESVQSGWGKTWELVIGNFEQAKESLTEISDLLTGEDSFLTKSADARNNFLTELLGSNWDKLVSKLGEAGVAADEFDKTLRSTLKDHGYNVDKVIKKHGSLEQAFRSGAISSYMLEKAISNIGNSTSKFTADLSKIDGMLHWGMANEGVKELQQALIDLGYNLDEFGADGKYGTETFNAVKAFQEAAGIKVDGWVGEQTLGALEEAAEKTKKLNKENKNLVDSYKDLISTIEETSGRELLMDSLKNVLAGLLKILSTVRDAWWSIFAIKPKSVLGFIKGLNEFTKKLVINEETAGKLKKTLEGLFSILNVLTTIAGGGIKLAFKALSGIFGNLDIGILDVTASIGETLVKFRDNVDETVDVVTDLIIDGVGSWIGKFKETELFKTVSGYFGDASDKISEVLSNISEKIDEFEVSTVVERLKTFGNFLSDIATNIANSEIFIAIVDGICGAFSKLSGFVKNIKLPEFNITNLTNFSKIAALFDDGSIINITGVITELGNYFKGINQFKWATFKDKALEKFVTFWVKTGDKVKVAFEKCKEIALSIKKFLFGTEEVNLPIIMDAVTKFLGIIALIKAIQALNTIVSPFENVTSALDNLATSLKWDAMASAFKSMALALGIFTACIVILTQMPDMKKAWSAAGMLMALMAVMGGIVIALGVVSSKLDGGVNTAGAVASLLMMVVSLMLLVKTIKEIDDLNLKNPAKTFGTLFLTLLVLSSGVKMVAKAGGSSFKSVAAILTLMAALKLVLEVIEDYDAFDWSGKSGAIKKMVTMLFTLAAAISIASRGVKAGASSRGLALLLIAMVVSLKLLLSVMKDFAEMDTDTLIKGGLTVTLLLSIMTGLAFALGKASGGMKLEKGQKSVNNFTGLAIALLAVVGAIWLLGKMDLNTLKQGGIAVAGILAAFTVMLGVVGKSCSGLKMGSVIAMLVMIGLLMAELSIIISYMKTIPLEQSIGSATALGILLLAIAFALRSMRMANVKAKDVVKWIGAMTAMAGVIAILAYILKQLKDVNPATSIGNVIALSGLLFAMAGVLTILTKHRNGAKSIYKWIGAMATLGLVVAELALVLHLIKGVDPVGSIGNVIALSGLLFAMTGVLTILTKHRNGAKSIYKWIGAMATLGLVVAELALVLHLVKDIDPYNAIGNVIALSALMFAMAGALAVIKVIKFDTGSFKGIIGLAAVAASLFIVVEVLRNMTGIEDARENAITLALLAGALSLCLIPLGLVGKLAGGGAIVGAITIAGLMASMFIVVEVLRNMTGIEDARENAITLSILAGALSLCMIPLAIAGSLAAGAIVGVVAMAGLMTSLFIVVGVLASMQGVQNARENASILAGLAAVLTALLIPLTLIGALGVLAITGVGVLDVLMVSLFIIVGVLATMQGIQNAQANADILIELLTTMTDALVQISLLSPLAVVGVAALSALVTLVGRLGVFVAAVGWLTENIDGLEDFVDNGLEIFKKLAGGLGEMVGAFAAGATSELPTVGDNLSKFAESAQYFIDNVGGVGEDVAKGAGNLALAVGALAAAQFANDITSFDGNALSNLGTDLSDFADNISGFLTAMSGMDTSAATGVDALCSAVGALVDANLKDSITQILPGDNSLSTFGTNLEQFASCINNASIFLKNITDEDVANIKRAADAGAALAELNGAIPAEGGWADKIMGSQSLATFGQSIDAFASCLVSYSAKVSGQSIDAGAIKTSAEAGAALAELNGAIPAEGGWADTIMGSQSLATFGQSINAFADCLVSYSNKVSGQNIDASAITASAEAASAIAELNGKLPGQDGLFQDIMGEQNLSTFGTQLSGFGRGLVSYANSVSNIDESKITAITNSGTALDELLIVMDKIPSTGGWKEKLFGSQDGQTFGAALVSMARGIADYCTTAATISDDDITAIQKSGTAVTELGNVLALAPESADSQKATALANAVSNLQSIGTTINSISEAYNDYSGLTSLKTAINTIKTMFTDFDTSSLSSNAANVQSAVNNLSVAAVTINRLSGYDYSGVDTFKDALTDLSGIDAGGLANSLSTAAPQIAAAVGSLVSTMTSVIGSYTTTISTAMGSVVNAALTAVDSKKDLFMSSGEGLVSSLASGLSDSSGSVSAAGGSLGNSATSGFRSKYSLAKGAGSYLALGFIRGLKEAESQVRAAAKDLANAAAEGIRVTLVIQSPSKLAEMFGAYTGEGFVNGLNSYTDRAYNAGSELGDQAAAGISNTVSKISDAINSDIDSQPTIRPVVDLSNVNSGASAIRSMFGGTYSLGADAHLGAITRMMGGRQNRGNDDVISAIKDLNTNLSKMGNTYTINGVTYDDGSNVREAVEAIVRAARVGRRV